MASVVLPWQRVRVSGPSMVPTLRDGDVVLVWHGRAVHDGDVVLATYRSMPGHYVLKRAERAAGDGWWLRSDNPAAGGGSAVHGIADVHARVLLRWGPPGPGRLPRWLRPPARVR